MTQYYSDYTPISQNLKNVFINPDFKVFQRGSDAITASGEYPVDRWRSTFSSSGAYSFQADNSGPSAALPGANSLKVTVTTADTSVDSGDWLSINYNVEGYDIRPFIGKTGTFSFWVKSSVTGTYSLGIRNNGGNYASYISEYTINQANTWEKKEITVTFGDTTATDFSDGWNYTNNIGLGVYFTLMVGSSRAGAPGEWLDANALGSTNQVNWAGTVSNTFYLCQPQFELGSIATDFEPRLHCQEIQLCKRYYYQIGGTEPIGVAAGVSGLMRLERFHPVAMRTTPTVSSDFGSTIRVYNNGTCSLNANYQVSSRSCMLVFQESGFTLTEGNAYVIDTQSVTGTLSFDAELL